MSSSTLYRWVALSFACLVPTHHVAAQSRGIDSLIKAYQAALTQTFQNLKNSAVPLYMANYKIADTWDLSMSRLLEEGQHCFGTLNVRSVTDAIPSVNFMEEASLGFLLRLKSLFDASAKASGSAAVTISFEDVVQQTVVEGDLRRTYRTAECPLLAAILHGDQLQADSTVPVVIGRLYLGRRNITVTYSDASEAATKLRALTGITAAGTVEVAARIGLEKSLVVKDREPIPLAFAPAFVPIRTSATQGPNSARPSYAWVPYDPNSFPSHSAALSDLAIAVNQAWTWGEAAR
jgi:hypothetical protein